MQINAINTNRLTQWEERLNNENSTPVILLGVGHGKNAGQVSILVPENIAADKIASILEGAAAGLRTGKLKLN